LTDVRHWTNRKTSWPSLLRDQLKATYKSEITLVNPAIGGTQLRQNLILMPRWLKEHPSPDLVTICFGYNDWDGGMRGPQFQETLCDVVDRIRRATQGKSEVLIMTTVPSLSRWETMKELAEAGRQAAQSRRAGLADTERAFLNAPMDKKSWLYAWD